jgi:hypothetical protein
MAAVTVAVGDTVFRDDFESRDTGAWSEVSGG